MKRLFIANRGEIAIRVAQAAADLGIETVSCGPADDSGLHGRRADTHVALQGRGVAAYLDVEGLVTAALGAQCDAVHPGYGFLSESAEFAQAVRSAGMVFVGPDVEALRVLGAKSLAVEMAESHGVAVADRMGVSAQVSEFEAFFANHPNGIMLKAALGGGGRGMRAVRDAADVAAAFEAVSAEAMAAFGSGEIYAEALVEDARHIEVQVIGDGAAVAHVWERECSVQRARQKVVEMAPAPMLDRDVRTAVLEAATTMAQAVNLRGLATFEFLVSGTKWVFIEANPRVQVEHTVTEAVTGIDLVQTQLRIAQGGALAELALTQADIPAPRGVAVQARVCCESLLAEGVFVPSGGVLTAYTPPSGPNIRVDGAGFVGFEADGVFDSLLAKVIVTGADHGEVLARLRRALGEFDAVGVETNIAVLRDILGRVAVADGTATTDWLDELLPALAQSYGAVADTGAAGILSADMPGTVLNVTAQAGDLVAKGTPILVMEAMKMQHTIAAPFAARVLSVNVADGAQVLPQQVLVQLEEIDAQDVGSAIKTAANPNTIRPDLQELLDRRALTQDAARPEAMAKRHGLGKRSARENVADLCDADSFLEYGDLTFAAQRKRRSVEDLMRQTPADGMVSGFGRINGGAFDGAASECAVMAYDYTVLAGTQGVMNHKKTDRMIAQIAAQKTPLVFFCEGGGGRPGDVDAMENSVAGLDVNTFWHFAQLSGLVPLIGIGSGRVFAGNAALLGCCDVIIATRDASIGMGGPAMIEGGGLGVYRPEEVGPTQVQAPNGVIDILVEDEAQAAAAAKQYLSYFQGVIADWTAPDPRALRHVVPENRVQVYDVHGVLEGLFDLGSVLEIRSEFARGMVTAFARIEGRPVGVIANNPVHLAGAIQSDGADKASRFVQLCDAFDIPIVSLCDTPGMMVGPEVERTALVRHCSRLFLTAGNADVPIMTVVLRKAYGLGAMAMAGGSFHTPIFTVAWPTGEFGGMGLEGAVRLGYRKELEAVADPAERQALFERMVAESYEKGKALNAAATLEVDTVIDPAETRAWIAGCLRRFRPAGPRDGKKRPFVDAW